MGVIGERDERSEVSFVGRLRDEERTRGKGKLNSLSHSGQIERKNQLSNIE